MKFKQKVDTAIAIFLILFGINFALYYLLLIGKIKEIFKSSELKLYIALVIGAIIMSYGLGPFPTYNDLPIATAFLGAIIGILIGSALLGGRAKGDH